jgi:putative transposase
MKSNNLNIKKYKKLSCPFCSSTYIIKRGFRKTQNRGKIQRYKCKECRKRFTKDNGFFRMRNSPQKITLSIDLFFRGVSTRKIQEHLQAFYPHNVDHSTILRWIRKYSLIISEFTDKLKIDSGIELMSDEMEYHRLGEQNWFVDVMDTKTRFVVSSGYMKSRTIEKLSEVLRKARITTGDKVRVVTTDGLRGYPRVLKKTFGLKSHWNHKSKIIHNVVIADERGFNHKIERLHNSIRERTKIFRGFHGPINSASAIMKGYEIFYNFIRKHQALKKCPYELAIPSLTLGTNKWLDLIKLAKNGM